MHASSPSSISSGASSSRAIASRSTAPHSRSPRPGGFSVSMATSAMTSSAISSARASSQAARSSFICDTSSTLHDGLTLRTSPPRCAATARRTTSRSATSAALTGLSKTSLARLEAGDGNPSLETLWRLGQALGLTIGQLLEGAGSGARAGAAVRARDRSWSRASGCAGGCCRPTTGRTAPRSSSSPCPPGARFEGPPHDAGTRELVHCIGGADQLRPGRPAARPRPGRHRVLRRNRPALLRRRPGRRARAAGHALPARFVSVLSSASPTLGAWPSDSRPAPAARKPQPARPRRRLLVFFGLWSPLVAAGRRRRARALGHHAHPRRLRARARRDPAAGRNLAAGPRHRPRRAARSRSPTRTAS